MHIDNNILLEKNEIEEIKAKIIKKPDLDTTEGRPSTSVVALIVVLYKETRTGIAKREQYCGEDIVIIYPRLVNAFNDEKKLEKREPKKVGKKYISTLANRTNFSLHDRKCDKLRINIHHGKGLSLVMGEEAVENWKEREKEQKKAKERKNKEINHDKSQKSEHVRETSDKFIITPQIIVIIPSVDSDLHPKIRPNILLPGENTFLIWQYLNKQCGECVAKKIIQIGQDTINAVEQFNYNQQIVVGEELEKIGRDNELDFIISDGLYLQAEGWRDTGNIERPLRLYLNALEEDPKSVHARRGAGIMFQKDEKFTLAQQYFEKAYDILMEADAPFQYTYHEKMRLARHTAFLLSQIRPKKSSIDFEDCLYIVEDTIKYYGWGFPNTEYFILDRFKHELFFAILLYHEGSYEASTEHFKKALKVRLNQCKNVLRSGDRRSVQWWGRSLNSCKEILATKPHIATKQELSTTVQRLYQNFDEKDQIKLSNWIGPVVGDLL
jgi:tetratricopeptide (TPR) repeat protein